MGDCHGPPLFHRFTHPGYPPHLISQYGSGEK
jgi:hypothetical protein